MAKHKLEDICEFITDGTHQTPEYCDENGVIFLSSKDVTERKIDWDNVKYIPKTLHEQLYKRLKPRKNDILLAKNGTTGVAAIVDRDEVFDVYVSLAVLRPKPDIYPKYLLYAINSSVAKRQFNAGLKGIGVPNLHLSVIRKTELNIAERDKQESICQLLDKVSYLIALRQQQLEDLDNLIKARFVEMFGMPLDRAKANMKFTDCVEFNPKKSEVKDLQDVEVSFVPMECVGVDGSFTIRENGPVSSYYKGYTYFRDGDVLLAKITPCFENGKAAIAEGCKNGIGFGTTEFHVARPKEGVSNSYWVKYMLKNDSVHDLATINMTGSAGQKRIQTPFFEKLTIFCPPIELQNQFAEFVKQVDKSKVAVQKSLDETQLLFDSLMQEYFG